MLQVIAQACALAVGIPHQGQGPTIAAALVAAAALSALALLSLRSQGSDLWIPYAGTLFAVPALLLLARPPEASP